ncbi:MAG TPA: hypothetical protein VFN61_02480 [Acidimicrobiales bacterium]|nr:hypothetical protein [Acidimicrobiales bacterium]
MANDLYSPDDLYVAKVRLSLSRLGVPGPDLEGALGGLRAAARFDVDVPTASPRREVQLVKTGVKRVSGWYLRYLADQLSGFGGALVNWADALAAKTQILQGEVDEVAVRLQALETRVARLEAGRQPGGDEREDAAQ